MNFALKGIFLSALMASGWLCSAADLETSTLITTEAPGNVFTNLKQPIFKAVKDFPAESVSYTVSDWRGAVIASGEWKNPKENSLSLAVKDFGYYTLSITAPGVQFKGAESFALVIDPSERTYNPDSFFAMDTAQSWLCRQKPNNPRQPEDGFKTVSDIAKLAGLSMIRERMSWGSVEAKPGEFAWAQYKVNADLLQERNIQICGMFHDAPKWTKSGSEKLPDDLFALYNFTKTATVTFKGQMTAWEFWNEQDISFCPDPAWDYAAAQKAAYLGFKAGNPDIPVLLGAFCQYPFPSFTRTVMKNGVIDYLNVFNYHSYFQFDKYPELNSDIRKLLAEAGDENVKVWFTENGSNHEGHGKINSYVKDTMEHNEDQELIMTEFTPKSQIIMQSCGVDRDFFFVLPAYNEKGGGKAWGMLRYDYTVKPHYVAFSNLTKQLSNAKYLGKYNAGEGIKAFLYEQQDGSQTLAFWSESELDKTTKNDSPVNLLNNFERDLTVKTSKGFLASLLGSDSDLTLSDSLGKTVSLKSEDGKLTVKSSRYVSYLSGLHGLKASEAAPSSGHFHQPPADMDIEIVLKARMDDPAFKPYDKSVAWIKADEAKISFDVYNFGDKEKSGVLKSTGSGSVSGLPEKISVPAKSKVTVNAVYRPSFAKGSASSDLSLSGVFNGKRISPIYIPVYSPNELEKCAVVKSLPFDKVERWRKNSSGDMTISYDSAEKALKVNVKFEKAKDWWAYPEFVLNLPSESLAGASAVSFEIKAVQKDNFKDYAYNYLMIVSENVKETGKAVNLPYNHPTQDWQTMFVSLENTGIKPEDIKMLRLGMNPKKEEVTWWVRNIKIYSPSK